MTASRLEQALSYTFRDQALFELALTHRSFTSPHNERLEFLGDAILNAVIARSLFERFPTLPEGDLSRLRAQLVRQDGLHQQALALSLGDYQKFSLYVLYVFFPLGQLGFIITLLAQASASAARVMCSRSATPTKILSCSRVMPDLLAPMIGKGDQSHQPKITVIPIRYTDRSFQNVDNRLTFIDQFGNRAIKHRSLEWIEDQSFDTRIPTAFAVHRHAAHQPLRDTVGAI